MSVLSAYRSSHGFSVEGSQQSAGALRRWFDTVAPPVVTVAIQFDSPNWPCWACREAIRQELEDLFADDLVPRLSLLGPLFERHTETMRFEVFDPDRRFAAGWDRLGQIERLVGDRRDHCLDACQAA